MNKSKLFILLFLSSLFTYSQQDENLEINIENLSKKWVAINVINSEKTEEELKEIIAMLEGTALEFRNDLTFTFSFVLDLEGTWSLKEHVIYTKDRKGNNKWVIHSLQDKKLIASRNESIQKIVFKSN